MMNMYMHGNLVCNHFVFIAGCWVYPGEGLAGLRIQYFTFNRGPVDEHLDDLVEGNAW